MGADYHWDQIKYIFDSRKQKSLAKELKLLISTAQISIIQGGDIIAELLRRDTDWMLEKVYPLFRIRAKFEIGLLDEHIFNSYCLAPGEEILDKFHVMITEGKVTTFGEATLTNVRLAVQGSQQVRSAQKSYGHSGIIGAAVRSKITHNRRNARALINKVLRADMATEELLEWGYSFPLVNARNIQRKAKRIGYTLFIDTAGKKPQKMNINITPRRTKQISKVEFAQKVPKILEQIEDILNYYA